jgi:hypothetical protein
MSDDFPGFRVPPPEEVEAFQRREETRSSGMGPERAGGGSARPNGHDPGPGTGKGPGAGQERPHGPGNGNGGAGTFRRDPPPTGPQFIDLQWKRIDRTRKPPPRPWMMGVWLLRGTTTLVVARSGVGKTTLGIAMALSIASGIAFLGQHLFDPTPYPVMLMSSEDDHGELWRRVEAAAMRYRAPFEALAASADPVQAAAGRQLRDRLDGGVDRLLVTGTERHRAGLGRLTLVEGDRFGPKVSQSALMTLKRDILASGVRLLIVDPLISFVGQGLNDNGVMSSLILELQAVAAETGCAIVIVHHYRKSGAGTGPSLDAAAGGGALTWNSRIVLEVEAMADDEGEEAGVPDEIRRGLISVRNGKENFSRSEDKTWFDLVPVAIANPEGVYVNGDTVQAMVPVSLDAYRAKAEADVRVRPVRVAALTLIAEGLDNPAGSWRIPFTQRKSDRWVVPGLADALFQAGLVPKAAEKVIADRETFARNVLEALVLDKLVRVTPEKVRTTGTNYGKGLILNPSARTELQEILGRELYDRLTGRTG